MTVAEPRSNPDQPERDGTGIGQGHDAPTEPIPTQKHANVRPEKVVPLTSVSEAGQRRSLRTPWTRRNFLIAAGALGVAGAGLWYTIQTNTREEEKNARERERNNYEFPPEGGPAIRINQLYNSAWIPNWQGILALPGVAAPQDFPPSLATDGGILGQIFSSGGAWCGRMSLEIVVESLRRSVILRRAQIEVRRIGPPFAGTLYLPLPIGGDGEEAEYVWGGVNLDAPRPTVRSLSEEWAQSRSGEEQNERQKAPLPLGGPFPGKQVSLGPHDQRAILIEAEARQGCYEWRLFLDLLADGKEQTQEITSQFPFRLTAPADSYSSVLREGPDIDGNVLVVTDTFDNVAFWR